MARQIGTVKIEGTLDDYSFYESVFGSIVRRKGGASKEKIKKDPAFERVREHYTEFGRCAKAGALLRWALQPLLPKKKEHSLTGRVNQLMYQLKNCDELSPKGERTPGKGLNTEKGRELMLGFDFNEKRRLANILFRPVTSDAENNTISIPGLQTSSHVDWPESATHVVLQGGLLKINIDEGQAELQVSRPFIFTKSDLVRDLEIAMPGTALATGEKFFLLKISYLSEENGTVYELAWDKSTGVVGVGRI